jgi:hypothetical protein
VDAELEGVVTLWRSDLGRVADFVDRAAAVGGVE